MTRTLSITRLAEADLTESFQYVAQDSPAMALQFFESFESACEQLCEFPELGSVREFSRKELTAVRMWPLPGFERFLLFYRILPESIEIVRVVHGARDLPALFR